MKKFLQIILGHLTSFIESSPRPPIVNHKIKQHHRLISEALKKHEAVHVIYQEKSFTGDIVKYDKEAGKLILNNFKKNMSVIIAISDIDKLTLVPPTIKQSQKWT